MIESYTPGVYKLNFIDNEYELVFDKPRFIVKGKNYGTTDRHVDIYWRRHKKVSASMGILLTGLPGSGKSRIAEILGNMAIDDGMCTLLITDVEINVKILPFISLLHNMVVIFDEFSKNFSIDIQLKMLTMLSSISPHKKLIILTENDRTTVSQFIRNRPTRAWYAHDYTRVEITVVKEYCSDNNVSDRFLKDIRKLHRRSTNFTFDHLQAIVEEHLDYPTFQLDTLLEVLNLDDLVSSPKVRIISVIKIIDKSKWEGKFRYIVPTIKELRDIDEFYRSVKLTPVITPVEHDDTDNSDKPKKLVSAPPDALVLLVNNNFVDINTKGEYRFKVDGFEILLGEDFDG